MSGWHISDKPLTVFQVSAEMLSCSSFLLLTVCQVYQPIDSVWWIRWVLKCCLALTPHWQCIRWVLKCCLALSSPCLCFRWIRRMLKCCLVLHHPLTVFGNSGECWNAIFLLHPLDCVSGECQHVQSGRQLRADSTVCASSGSGVGRPSHVPSVAVSTWGYHLVSDTENRHWWKEGCAWGWRWLWTGLQKTAGGGVCTSPGPSCCAPRYIAERDGMWTDTGLALNGNFGYSAG